MHEKFDRHAAVERIASHTGIEKQDIQLLSLPNDLLEDMDTVIHHNVPDIKTFKRVSVVFGIAAAGLAAASIAQPCPQELFNAPAYPELTVAMMYLGTFGFGVFASLFGFHLYNLKQEVNGITTRLQDSIRYRKNPERIIPSPE